jgi:hypothetical protein
MKLKVSKISLFVSGAILIGFFQNCGQNMLFRAGTSFSKPSFVPMPDGTNTGSGGPQLPIDNPTPSHPDNPVMQPVPPIVPPGGTDPGSIVPPAGIVPPGGIVPPTEIVPPGGEKHTGSNNGDSDDKECIDADHDNADHDDGNRVLKAHNDGDRDDQAKNDNDRDDRPKNDGDRDDHAKNDNDRDDQDQKNKGHCHKQSEASAQHYACILQDDDKPQRIGLTHKLEGEDASKPSSVCMSKHACLDIVSGKFSVKNALHESACSKDPDALRMTDNEVAELIAP